MRWFYEFCSRVASMHRDNIKDEIEEQTKQLNHARHCARVCNEAERIGNITDMRDIVNDILKSYGAE